MASLEDVGGDGGRVEVMYGEAYGRPPTALERSETLAFVAERVGAGSDAAGAWSEVGHALFNAKEFQFVR